MGSHPKPVPAQSALLAYVVGVALGDGNLSINGRAIRLRISCDAKYPELAAKIRQALNELLPHNRVSTVPKTSRCFDISCHSKHWETLLGWHVGYGSKIDQQVCVPGWIKSNRSYLTSCLRGLLETDGSLYDRGYPMVMFVTAIPVLAQDVLEMISSLGYYPRIYRIMNEKRKAPIYHVRLSKRVKEFLSLVGPQKA